MQTLAIALPAASSRESTTIICTASSDGKIFLYDLASLPASPADKTVLEILPVAEYDSKGTRLTCVTLADGDVEGSGAAVNGKRKRAEEGENEPESGGEDAEWGGIGGDGEGEGDDDSAWEDEAEDEAEKEGEGDSD